MSFTRGIHQQNTKHQHMSDLHEKKVLAAQLIHLANNYPEAKTALESIVRSYSQQGAFNGITFSIEAYSGQPMPETEY
jgi:hypothetical protein